MAGSGDLHKFFLNNGHLELFKWIHYFDIYERHFEKFRDRPIKMLEIGVLGGGSLQMWSNYFHPESTIVGIDINPDCAQFAGGNVEIQIGSQDDAGFLEKVADQYGEFDVLLDDGSHINSHVVKTFDTLYSRMAKNSVYMVEDMHTSYWRKYGGGLRREGTFIEYAKNKIDELNAVHVRGDYPATDFTRSTDSMTFYDSVVVFEKRPQGRRQDMTTAAM